MAFLGAWLAVPALHVVVLSWLAPFGRMREPVHFDYRAPAGCPDAATFVGQVQARTQRFRVAEQGETARRLLVNVSHRDAPGHVSSAKLQGELTGRLTLRELDGGESVREVAGASCGEIVDALALIAALAIDPQAMTWPQEPAAAVPLQSPAPPPRLPTVRSHVHPIAQPHRAWSLGVGAHVGAIVGVAPDVLVYPSAFVEFAKFRESTVALSVRLGFARATDEVTLATGAASFTLTVALAQACAFPVRLAARLSLQPCGHFMAGVLRGAGQDLPNPRQTDRPWVSVGVTAGFRWQIHRRLAVEIENALGAALVRDWFVFEPDVTVHKVPAVHGTIRGGLVLSW